MHPRTAVSSTALIVTVAWAMPALAQAPAASSSFSAPAIVEHVKVLASDEFEGRAPGGKGEDLTVKYLTEQFKALGLAPGNPDGTFVQAVPMVSMTTDPKTTLTFEKGGSKQTLAYRDDFVAWTRRVVDRVAVENSDLVFVGYGVTAPEFDWDDYKGVDLTGKTMVVLIGDPPVPDPADPKALDPKVFGGRAMTYYGRWTYKFETGAAKRAAGVLIVHETGPAGYPFSVVQGMGGEKFDLRTPDKNMGRAAVEGWISRSSARSNCSRWRARISRR